MPGSGKIKQKTVNGKTITLHQLKNTFEEINSNNYMYEVRLDGAPVGDPVFTRAKGEDEFRAMVRGEESSRDGSTGGRGGQPAQYFGGGVGGGFDGGGLFGGGGGLF